MTNFIWTLIAVEVAAAVATLMVLVWVVAPYGRHERPGWGPTLPARWAWVLMESPAVILFSVVVLMGESSRAVTTMAALWLMHYVNRSFIYPLRMRADGKRMPLVIAVLGALFNTLNAVMNGGWVAHVGDYGSGWLTDPRFVLGTLVFVTGFGVNIHSDAVLRALRRPGEQGYKIPWGGAHRWVACPNYLGELVAWCGWALLTWSPAGAAFALYTFANLAPRAAANRAWSRAHLDGYPMSRKRLLPGIW